MAASEDSDAQRDDVLGRALGGRLALAEGAHRREYGGDFAVIHGPAERWHLPPDVVDSVLAEPAGWLEAERLSLGSAVSRAAALRKPALARDLAMTSATLFEPRGHLDDWQRTHACVLEACRQGEDVLGRAAMTYSLGSLELFRQRYEAAARLLEEALEMFAEVGSKHGHALALRNLALVDRLAGRFDLALQRYRWWVDYTCLPLGDGSAQLFVKYHW
ncbi:tetratricopeptide repeat protein [Streptomyces sp. NPDC059874]|uniref:tetratricopeptide repeat protein n=1 Tax=Streptomyces sp. NPDC059874 TaxID=3346983 RepID=UPI003647B7DF